MAKIDNSPSAVLIWLEQFIRDLEERASQEVLTQHFSGLSLEDVQLRLLFLGQMVASHTATTERKQWSIELITHMARHEGVELDDDPNDTLD